MLEIDTQLTELRSKLEFAFGRPLTDAEFEKVPAVKKLKKNTSSDVTTANEIDSNYSTTTPNLQDDYYNEFKNFDYQKYNSQLFDGDMENEFLGSLLLPNAAKYGIIPSVASNLQPEDFYYKENQIIFKNILAIHSRGVAPNITMLIEELRSNNEIEKVGLNNVLAIANSAFTTAYAETYAKKIKEFSAQRKLKDKLSNLLNSASDVSTDFKSLLSDAEAALHDLNTAFSHKQAYTQEMYLTEIFQTDVENNKLYEFRLTGFPNIDDGNQIFNPGLYVIGATPACGKTTFCWQLLDQLAAFDENCIFCSYEMSRAEMYTKSLAREFFKKTNTTLTAAQIRRGVRPEGFETEFDEVLKKLSARRGITLFEFRDENVDDLLRILSPLCSAKGKSPVVCIER